MMKPALFMMAGLTQVSTGERRTDPTSSLLFLIQRCWCVFCHHFRRACADLSPGAPASLRSHIPTVMLSSTDGEFVTSAVNYLTSKGMTARLNVDVLGLPAVLDSRLMGYSDHPTVRMSDALIHVHGLGAWGALLSLSAEGQWQLYIVPSSDLTVLTPWNVQTSQGHPYCTNSDFSLDPAKTYLRLTQERCPSSVLVTGAHVIEVKK